MMLDTKQNYVVGILWMVFAGLLFVGVTIIVRHLGSDMPAAEAAFIRYIFGLIFLIPAIFRFPWRSLNTEKLTLFTLRGLAHGIGVLLWFYAMARIPIAEVTAIGYTTPIFTAIGAVLIFREKIYVRRISAIIIGFIGTLIILRPGFQDIETGSIAQLLAAPCFAISYLFTKRLTRTERPTDILVMLSIFCTLVLLPAAIMQWRDPTMMELFWLAIAAVFATAGHYAITKSFACAPLTVTQPFSFLQLIWAVIFGYVLFAEKPDIWIMVGGLVIVSAVSYLSHREALIKKPLTNQPPPL